MHRFSLFILTGGLTCLALIGCQSNISNKIYTATALIQIEPRSYRYVGSRFTLNDYPDLSDYQPELDTLQSNDLLLPIIKNLGLDKKWAKRFKSNQEALTPTEVLDRVHKVLTINFKLKTGIVGITAQSEESQEAADIANAVADHYIAWHHDELVRAMKSGIVVLQEEITHQQAIVHDKKTVVEKLRVSNNTSSSRRAQQELEKQQYILDTYVLKLKQVMNESPSSDSSVRIVNRAIAPK